MIMIQNKYNGSDATTPVPFTEARANYDYVADNIAQPKTPSSHLGRPAEHSSVIGPTRTARLIR
jgi:hypothetical protein